MTTIDDEHVLRQLILEAMHRDVQFHSVMDVTSRKNDEHPHEPPDPAIPDPIVRRNK